jgi:hypothetical protein
MRVPPVVPETFKRMANAAIAQTAVTRWIDAARTQAFEDRGSEFTS